MMRKVCKRHTPWIGMAASVIIAVGAGITAYAFHDQAGHSYSFLQRNISDLGNSELSAWSGVFNYCLTGGSLMMAVFIVGICILVHRPGTYVVGAFGVFTTLAMALVGVYTSDHATDQQHIIVSALAFLGTIGLGGSFTLYMVFSPEPAFPRWLLVPGLLTAAAALSFVVILMLRHGGVFTPAELTWRTVAGRPGIDLVSVLEWSVLFSILTWSALTALSMMRGQVSLHQPQDDQANEEA